MNDDGSALYFYGVSRGRAARAPQILRGIDAAGRVESRECSGLTCWFSRVDRSEYGDQLERNMENLEWLANASVHHQRVVGSIGESADILPARFGTVFLSESSLAAHVAGRKESLAKALERIEGASEWGVKVFAEAPAVKAQSPATSGTDYLRKKREQLQQRAKPAPPAGIDRMSAELEGAAVASLAIRGKTPQPGVVWQASFLVKRNREKAFHEILRKFAAKMESARIETSGPWPPYSFAGAGEEQAGPGEKKTVRSTKKAAGEGVRVTRSRRAAKTRASRPRPHR